MLTMWADNLNPTSLIGCQSTLVILHCNVSRPLTLRGRGGLDGPGGEPGLQRYLPPGHCQGGVGGEGRQELGRVVLVQDHRAGHLPGPEGAQQRQHQWWHRPPHVGKSEGSPADVFSVLRRSRHVRELQSISTLCGPPLQSRPVWADISLTPSPEERVGWSQCKDFLWLFLSNFLSVKPFLVTLFLWLNSNLNKCLLLKVFLADERVVNCSREFRPELSCFLLSDFLGRPGLTVSVRTWLRGEAAVWWRPAAASLPPSLPPSTITGDPEAPPGEVVTTLQTTLHHSRPVEVVSSSHLTS